jgi:hypothetical protein
MRLLTTGGTGGGLMPVPYLLSPANNSTGTSVTPNLVWTLLPPDDPSVYNYELQITDELDPTIVFTYMIYNTTSLQVTEPLLYEHSYSWKVRAILNDQIGGCP